MLPTLNSEEATIPMGILHAMPVNARKSHFCTITYVRGVVSKRGQNSTYRRQKRSNPDAFVKKDAKTDALCLTHLHIFVAHPRWRYQKGRFTGPGGPKRGSNRGPRVVSRSFPQTLTAKKGRRNGCTEGRSEGKRRRRERATANRQLGWSTASPYLSFELRRATRRWRWRQLASPS